MTGNQGESISLLSRTSRGVERIYVSAACRVAGLHIPLPAAGGEVRIESCRLALDLPCRGTRASGRCIYSVQEEVLSSARGAALWEGGGDVR